MEKKYNRLISREKAAEILECHPQTVSNWVEQGIIKGHKVGNNLLVDKNTILALLDTAQDVEHATKEIQRLQAATTTYRRNLEIQLQETGKMMTFSIPDIPGEHSIYIYRTEASNFHKPSNSILRCQRIRLGKYAPVQQHMVNGNHKHRYRTQNVDPHIPLLNVHHLNLSSPLRYI